MGFVFSVKSTHTSGVELTIADSPKHYFSSRRLDSLFIIGTPLLSLLVIVLFCRTRMQSGLFLQDPKTPSWLIVGSSILTFSHIMLVYFRSHANPTIFKRFRYRFTLVPLILLFALCAVWTSPVLVGIVGFISVYWDEWHSVMQTFGFGRIYDSKVGGDANLGRKLDIGLCLVIGLLPHIILLTFIPKELAVKGAESILDLDPASAQKYGHLITAFREPLIIFGVDYVLFYIWQYWRLIKRGYKYSSTKFFLFVSTGMATILMSSFFTLADAAYFGNIYHALQYFFIIYLSEGSRLSGMFGIKKENQLASILFYCVVILGSCAFFAVIRNKTQGFGYIGAFWILTSLMHFWYDGFIWSVRKQQHI